MVLHFPTKIIPKRLRQNSRAARNGHHDVMFESLPADVVQNVLQIRNVRDGAVAEGVERVVCEFAFADVAADFALGIGGGNAAIRQRPGGRAAVERTVSVFHADDAAEDRRGGNFDVGQK